MQSRRTYIPSHRLWNSPSVRQRVACDALARGILFPPEPETLPGAVQRLLTGENIFQDLPFPLEETGVSIQFTDQRDAAILTIDLQRFPDLTWATIETLYGGLRELLGDNGRAASAREALMQYSGIDIGSADGIPHFYLDFNGIYSVIRENNNVELIKLTGDPEAVQVLASRETEKALLGVIFDAHRPQSPATIVLEPVSIDNLLTADTRRAQLPPLDKGILTDAARGLWAAWWPPAAQPDPRWYVAAELENAVEAADPWETVRHGSQVAIDFGTSSTVAAVREEDGRLRLLRIGGDWQGTATAMQYENPTALEFSNYEGLLEAWQHEPWRPLILWEDIKCAHQAREELRAAGHAACGMRSIKTWAREQPGRPPLRLRDEKQVAFELSPLPIAGEEGMHEVGDVSQRPVDPIELYACFLGFSLNNQVAHGGTIYPRYYLTFPVKFDRRTRDRILQGFRRGLLRSLPPSLVYGEAWRTEPPFRIEEVASEPTAFAAGVLPHLGISPSEGGEAFGVFDFGGGTTDFSFGLYRTASPGENENEGWETVLDILDVSGDEYLGGEHLLDLAAWHVIRDNAAALLAAGIPFLCPAGLSPFDGSELLFTESTEAQANTVVLREAMRPLWEEGRFADDETGTLSLNLLAREGKDANGISLRVDAEALRSQLKERIRQGVRAFFTTFRQAFKMHDLRPETLHVLLAGNSCRSPLVQDVFEENIREILPEEHERIRIHRELLPGGENGAGDALADAPGDGLRPTLKTGVAIGMLHVLPGEPTGMVERNRRDAESPFLFTVGVFRADILQPVLERNAAYGQWQRLPQKVVRSGVTKIGYSPSPLALEGEIRRTQCRERNIEWGTELFGRRICLRADDPHHISVALEVADSSGEGDIQVDETTLRSLELRA